MPPLDELIARMATDTEARAALRDHALADRNLAYRLVTSGSAAAVYETLSPLFSELTATDASGRRQVAKGTLLSLNQSDPKDLVSPDRRKARERELRPARAIDPRWIDHLVPLFEDSDAALSRAATDVVRCILVSVPPDALTAAYERLALLADGGGIDRRPLLFNALGRTRDERFLSHLRRIAAAADAMPLSRVRAASALVFEAEVSPEERSGLLLTILEVVASTDDVEPGEASIPALEAHATSTHASAVLAALAHWRPIAAKLKATRYEIPKEHVLVKALSGVAKDLGVSEPKPARRRTGLR